MNSKFVTSSSLNNSPMMAPARGWRRGRGRQLVRHAPPKKQRKAIFNKAKEAKALSHLLPGPYRWLLPEDATTLKYGL